ncbi:MAG: dihydroorotase, partial [Sulfurimonas sp.]|nr:dihydroorotase [Sulfurimonas sp.]
MIFKSAIVCDVNGERECDLRVENGVIAEIGIDIKGDETTDAKGLYLMPLLVDLNIKTTDSTLNEKNIKAVA